MASDNVLLSRDNRQWVLTTAVRFSGSDFNTATDSTNYARIITRPKTLLLRGGLYVITAETAEVTAQVGTAADPNKYGDTLAIGTTGDKAVALALPEYLVESTTIYVTYSSAGANETGDYILRLEYLVEGRANEAYS